MKIIFESEIAQSFAKNIFGILQSIKAREEGSQKHKPSHNSHTPSVVRSLRNINQVITHIPHQ
jgi:hypothetical protein